MRKFRTEIKRIVVKVGSSSITRENGSIDIERIEKLAREISLLKDKGYEVILVSSGAIACGASGFTISEKPTETAQKQAVASYGQVCLMNNYTKAFSEYDKKVGQFLFTAEVRDNATMKENARNTLDTVIKMGIIPIVNENDAISNYEIQFGDNDTLSAHVAEIAKADLLVLLSDIDGLFTDDPKKNPEATLIPEVEALNDELIAMAKDTDSKVGTGGMATKIKAAKICMDNGIDMIIANSDDFKNLRKISDSEEIGTYFIGKCREIV